MAQDHRRIALRHILNAIDSAPQGTYDKSKPRQKLFAQLIETHGLKDPNQRRRHGQPRQILTPDRYYAVVREFARKDGVPLPAFFRKGSRAFRVRILMDLDYTAPAAEVHDKGGNSMTSQGGNDERESDESASGVIDLDPGDEPARESYATAARSMDGEQASEKLYITERLAQITSELDANVDPPSHESTAKADVQAARTQIQVEVREQIMQKLAKTPHRIGSASVRRPSISPLTPEYRRSSSAESEIIVQGNSSERNGKRKYAGKEDCDDSNDPPAKLLRSQQSSSPPPSSGGSRSVISSTPAMTEEPIVSKARTRDSSRMGKGDKNKQSPHQATRALPKKSLSTFVETQPAAQRCH